MANNKTKSRTDYWAPEVWSLIGAAAGRIGEADFHERLGAAFAAAVGVDRWLVMRFGAEPAPEILSNRGGMTDEAISFYYKGLYRLDPLTRLSQSGDAPLVVAISRLRAEDRDNRYYDEIYRTALIRDEIALMLPCGGGLYMTLNLDAADGEFSDATIARAHTVAETFLGLHQAHLGLRGVHQPASPGTLENADRLPAYDELIALMAQRTGMTEREREIAHRALRGYPNALIARDLGITVGTVRNHRARLYAKLDITSERELFSLCLATLLEGAGA